MRYIKAFFTALSLTMQGKTIEIPEAYPNLQLWLREAQHLLTVAYAAAEAEKLDLAARKAFSLRLDGRNWSMELVLSSLQFHLSKEYPSLLKSRVEHNLTTLYALNLDDQYRMSQLAAADLPASLKNAVQALATHLQNVPSSQNP